MPNGLKLLLQSRLFLFLCFLFFIAIILFVLFFIPSQPRPSGVANTVSPRPTSSLRQLTQEEKEYPEGPNQPFPSINNQTGILVVTASLDDVRVVIDPSEEEVTGGEQSPRYIMIAPFKIPRMPVGEHIITASKPGYNFISRKVRANANEITRINLELEPLPTNGAFYHP